MAKSDLFFGSHPDAQAILLNELFHEFQLLDRSRFKSFFRLPDIEDLPSKSYLIPNVFLKPFACSSNLEKKPSLTTCVVNFIPA